MMDGNGVYVCYFCFIEVVRVDFFSEFCIKRVSKCKKGKNFEGSYIFFVKCYYSWYVFLDEFCCIIIKVYDYCKGEFG